MIYLFYGQDIKSAKDKANLTIKSLLGRRKDATLVKISDETITDERMAELLSAQALFVNKFIVYLSGAFSVEDNKALISKRIKDIAESDNIFVIAEEKIDAKTLEKIKKNSAKIQEFKKSEKRPTKKELLAQRGEKIDFFEFSDALGERNKRKLWGLYQDALFEDVPAEEVHGIFFWQIKSMLLAKKCKTADDAGMKSFPFTKARGFAQNFTKEELENTLSNLVEMYHESHRGNADMYIELEKFILSL